MKVNYQSLTNKEICDLIDEMFIKSASVENNLSELILLQISQMIDFLQEERNYTYMSKGQ